jgi:hypothetical protein
MYWFSIYVEPFYDPFQQLVRLPDLAEEELKLCTLVGSSFMYERYLLAGQLNFQ